MTDSVDFLIVGASVAGSVLAAKFAKHGKVVFVDKYIPGTLMNCGGGMPEKVFKSFDVNIPCFPVKKAVMKIHGKEYGFPCNYVVVDRSELDKALYEKACKAGAEFIKMNFTGCDDAQQIANFRADRKEVAVKYKTLILAHGFHPSRNPFTRGERKLSSGAARVEIVDCKSPYPDTFYFEVYGKECPGYSWIFPMPDGKTNIGSGGFKGITIYPETLSNFKSTENISAGVLRKGGGVLPLKPAWKVQQGNICLFGDSAGMVNALNGEGLLHIDKFADKYVNAVLKGKNLNLFWKTSLTFWYLVAASFVLKFTIFSAKYFKIPLYPPACRLVAFTRRMLGKEL